MLKPINNALTIVHIRIHHLKLFGISVRHIVTCILMVIIIFNALRAFLALQNMYIWGFFEAGLFTILAMYLSLAWIIAWPQAGKMLNKASEYGDGSQSDSDSDSSDDD